MPIKMNLPDKKFPMKWFHGEEPTTEFFEALNGIEVKLMYYPSIGDILGYAAPMGLATWESRPRDDYTTTQRHEYLIELFSGKTLPTVMETINFVFLISYIDLVDVTHLIRHRTMSFSAHCTGDRDQRHDAAMVKPSIMHSCFYSEYRNLVQACKKLYADMVDSEYISVLDARTILPRCLENHYYARVNLKDFIHFLHQRLDRQIQPESDNIIALRMLIEVGKRYPEIYKVIDLDAPDQWFVKTAQTDHSSNLYMPEIPRNDIFDYKPQWFVYKKQRKEMLGGNIFTALWEALRQEARI